MSHSRFDAVTFNFTLVTSSIMFQGINDEGLVV
jgi:hypothetical protein